MVVVGISLATLLIAKFLFKRAHAVHPEQLFHREIKAYNTLGGKKVTKENLSDFAQKAPSPLAKKVLTWFANNPDAYPSLVKQKRYLTDIGTQILQGEMFFETHKELGGLSSMSYIFKVPGENFLMKICGPSNRFYNSIAALGLDNNGVYIRRMQKMIGGEKKEIYQYMDFKEDKKRIRQCFIDCCPKDFLHTKPSGRQLKEFAYMIAGAMPQTWLGGTVKANLDETFLKKGNIFKPETLQEALDTFLDYSFQVVARRCCKKSELAHNRFIETYNIASRVFHRNRFQEAIEKFKLDTLEIPPASYIINVNPKEPNSFVDRNVVLVQKILKGYKPLDFYVKNKDKLDEVFTQEALTQLLRALKYAGVWDISGKNILANPNSKKLTYVDFEHNRDIEPDELFNASNERRKNNLCRLVLELLRRFVGANSQRATVFTFIQNNKEIDLNAYIKRASSRSKGLKNGPPIKSLLGRLLYFDDYKSDKCAKLRKAIAAKLRRI